MHDAFISYSSKELAQAETIRNVLEKNGIPCWMAPRDIPGGSNYSKEIPIAIRACQVFVLLLSENAQSSHWVLKELDAAVNNGKVILPFMLEDCQLNDEFNFLLTGAQRYAAYQKKTEAMETLIRRIRAITGSEKTAPAEEPEQTPVELPADVPAKPAEGCCPACGSEKHTELKHFKRVTLAEKLTLLLIPVAALAAMFVLLIVGGVISLSVPTAVANALFGLCMLLGLLGGGWLCNHLTCKLLRRARIRHQIHPNTLRCDRCQKAFLVHEQRG